MNIKVTYFIISCLLILFSFNSFSQSDENKYQNTIAQADNYFSERDYMNAKAAYQYAAKLKPEEQYPKDQLKKSIVLLRDQIKKKDQYQKRLKIADQLFQDKSYENAITAYEEAVEVLPDEEYPLKQIEKARNLISEEAENRKKYESIIAEANGFMNKKEFENAKTKYETALQFFSHEQYPKDKIREIEEHFKNQKETQSIYEKTLNDADYNIKRKDYHKAWEQYKLAAEIKPEEDLPKQKIKELEIFLITYENYNSLVSEADNLYIEKKYDNAKEKYQEALAIMPDENYPRELIKKIDAALDEKAIEDWEKYDEWIVKADQLFNEENYENAMLAYQNALNFRSNEKYATKKISKINEILNYRETREEAYKNSIARADKLFAEQQYTGSRAEYEKAHEIKPMEQYPNVRIDEIDAILAKIKNKKEIYDHTLAGADKLYNTGNYEVAMVQYKKALEIFPGKQYPKNQIIMINDILDMDKTTLEAYEKAIALADQYSDQKEYDNAKVEYMNALDIKPDEQYPKDRISEINAILNEITRQQAINENYNKAITNADQFFNESNYEKAKEAYEAALTLKPNESYPKRRISEATVFILSAMEAKKKEYRKAIADADKYFNQNIYDKAIDKYMTAHDVLPNEPYPVDMVNQIKKIINDNAIVDINRENVLIQENTEKRFDFNPMPVSVRKANYILIKARNPVDRKFKILVNFGKNNSKNGGVAIKIPESKDINDYIIRISAQYKWFSEDNNWISIYSEGGELEVSLIRISKSD